MRKLDLEHPQIQDLIQQLRRELSLEIEVFVNKKKTKKKVIEKGTIEEVYLSKSGENLFINARVFSKNLDGKRITQNAFISVYYDKKVGRVEKAVIIPDATFTPVFGSDMMGILDTPNGAMMTYSIGGSISNNSPIEFEKTSEGVSELPPEVALLTFKFRPEDFKSRLGLEPDEKPDSICGRPDNYLYLMVDKKGFIWGELYDSTLNRSLPTRYINLSELEEEFIFRAINQFKDAEQNARRKKEGLSLI